MITLRHTASAIVLSTLIVMGGCKKKDGPAAAKDLKVEAVDASLMKKLLEVEDRDVSEAEAERALKAMGLGDSDVSVGSMSGEKGDYVYKNLSFAADEADVTVAEISFDGVHMEGEDPSFDRIKIKDLSISDEDGKGSIGSLTIARPHPELAGSILTALGNLDNLDGLDMDVDLEGESPFGAIMLEGMSFAADDADVSINMLGWGTDETTGKGTILAKDLSVKVMEGPSPVNLSLKTVSIKDLSPDFMNMMKGSFGAGFTGDYDADIPTMDPAKSAYDSILIDDLKINMDSFYIDMDGMKAKSTTKGDITTEVSALEPVRIGFKSAPEDYELMEMYEVMNKMGYSEFEFTGGGTTIKDGKNDTVTVEGGYIKMTDGFKVSYDFKGSGMSSMMKAQSNPMSYMDNPLAAYADMKIHKLNLEFADDSIMERGFNLAAEESGMSAAMLRGQASMGLGFMEMMAETPADKKAIKGLAGPVSDFINDGGTLILKMEPSSPVAMGDLENVDDPVKLISKLGLKVSHKN